MCLEAAAGKGKLFESRFWDSMRYFSNNGDFEITQSFLVHNSMCLSFVQRGSIHADLVNFPGPIKLTHSKLDLSSKMKQSSASVISQTNTDIVGGQTDTWCLPYCQHSLEQPDYAHISDLYPDAERSLLD